MWRKSKEDRRKKQVRRKTEEVRKKGKEGRNTEEKGERKRPQRARSNLIHPHLPIARPAEIMLLIFIIHSQLGITNWGSSIGDP